MKMGYGVKPWTPEEEERLRSLISERLRPHEIAVKLHRTVELTSCACLSSRLGKDHEGGKVFGPSAKCPS
jgi:hypothetical protein